jgi:outer membrane protein assembly factor BamB
MGDIMKNGNRATCVVVLGVLLLGTSCAHAQDWPQWRGLNRDAKVTGFNAPATWPKELTQKWKVQVSDGVATPALVGDKLYVFSRVGGDEILRCLDADSGKEIWQDKYASEPAERPAQSFPGPRCSPTVVDGKVVTLGVRGTISCLDAAGGKVLWRKDEFKGWPSFYTSSSPLVVDGLCIAELGGGQGAIVAYDLAGGDQKWKWTGDGTAYASPVLLTVDGTKAIIAEMQKSIVGIGLVDGKLLWQIPFQVRYNACTPIVDGQTVIYSGAGKGTTAVKIEKQGDKFEAKQLWSNQDADVQFNSPVVKDGLLFGITPRDEFFCMNMQDGKVAWKAPAAQAPRGGQPGGSGQAGGKGKGRGGRGGGMGGGGYGSIVDAGSVLIALTPSSQLIVFQPSDKAYTELARIKVADTKTYAYPVVSGSRIFIKDQDSVKLLTIP